MFVRSHVGAELHRSEALRTGPLGGLSAETCSTVDKDIEVDTEGSFSRNRRDRGSSCGEGEGEGGRGKSEICRGVKLLVLPEPSCRQRTLQKIHTLLLHFASFPEVALRLPPLLSHHIFSLCPQTRGK